MASRSSCTGDAIHDASASGSDESMVRIVFASPELSAALSLACVSSILSAMPPSFPCASERESCMASRSALAEPVALWRDPIASSSLFATSEVAEDVLEMASERLASFWSSLPE